MDHRSDDARAPRARRRNPWIWLGPPIVFVAAVGYFMPPLVNVAALRDFPWLNLPIVLLGAVVSLVGLRRAFDPPRRIATRVLAGATCALSLALALLFHAYVFWFSYSLPPPSDTTVELTTLPGFVLQAQDGRTVASRDYAGRKLVLVFYRGFW